MKFVGCDLRAQHATRLGPSINYDMASIRLFVAILMLLVSGSTATAEDTSSPAPLTTKSDTAMRVAVLRNIPTNSDKRCVGIAVVAEALLDGVQLEENGFEKTVEKTEEIAERIYLSPKIDISESCLLDNLLPYLQIVLTMKVCNLLTAPFPGLVRLAPLQRTPRLQVVAGPEDVRKHSQSIVCLHQP